MKRIARYHLAQSSRSANTIILIDPTAPRGAEIFQCTPSAGQKLTWTVGDISAEKNVEGFQPDRMITGSIGDALRGTSHRIANTNELAAAVARTITPALDLSVKGSYTLELDSDDLTFCLMVDGSSAAASGPTTAPKRSGKGKDRNSVWI